MLDLALAITTSWPVYSGCDPETMEAIRRDRDDDVEERVGNAIEMAIISKAKIFIKSSPCQRIIDAIWTYVVCTPLVVTLADERTVASVCTRPGAVTRYSRMYARL
jgi:hypothetical protein